GPAGPFYRLRAGKKATRVRPGPSDWELQVLDVKTRGPVVPPLGFAGRVEQAALSADGSKLATVVVEEPPANKGGAARWVVRVWDLRNEGRPVGPTLEQDQLLTHLAVSGDGSHVVAYCPGAPPAGSVSFRLFQQDRGEKTFLWDVRAGKAAELPHTARVLHAAFSPAGPRLATASEDRPARVWSSASGAPVTPPLEHQAAVNHVAFSPDGLALATASNDGTARLWDAATGEVLSPALRHRDWVLA